MKKTKKKSSHAKKKKKKVRNFYDYIVQQIPLLKLPFSINSSNQIKSHTKTSIKHQIKGKKNKQQTIKTKRPNTKIKKKKKNSQEDRECNRTNEEHLQERNLHLQ